MPAAPIAKSSSGWTTSAAVPAAICVFSLSSWTSWKSILTRGVSALKSLTTSLWHSSCSPVISHSEYVTVSGSPLLAGAAAGTAGFVASAARRLGGSAAAWRLGGSAARRLGGSAARRLGRLGGWLGRLGRLLRRGGRRGRAATGRDPRRQGRGQRRAEHRTTGQARRGSLRLLGMIVTRCWAVSRGGNGGDSCVAPPSRAPQRGCVAPGARVRAEYDARRWSDTHRCSSKVDGWSTAARLVAPCPTTPGTTRQLSPRA